jgi:hypothetical protein
VAAPIRHGLAVRDGSIALAPTMPPFATLLAWVTPFDPMPPATPRWIEAAAEHGNAMLRWTPDTAPELYGYELLRLDPPHRIAPMPLRAAMWIDTAPPPGVALRYGVRAVSASGLRSELAVSPPLRL